ncbi:MAG: TonB-dependent receptor [Bacteroidales bacterium]|jgi:outer membrane receptor for ferrienterochelin and colicin|nr:TonB-dependent receptor [Bacteroidales bacterium]
MKSYLFLFFALILCSTLSAQNIFRAIIKDAETKEPLTGVNAVVKEASNGGTTDQNGAVTLQNIPDGEQIIEFSYIGYETAQRHFVFPLTDNNAVTILLETAASELDQVVVVGRLRGNYLSRLAPVQTEIITSSGLQKMACCNLAESFENSATVTVGFTDAVSGAKQVQMLGLSGIYTQMLDENIPTLRGLSSAFGWNYIPGPWLESMQVSKGTSSVVNGYESTTGQINLELRKPDKSELLFLNLFGAEDGRLEANVSSAIPVRDKLWTGLMAHGSIEQVEHDANKDGFMDMPKTKLFNIYNRWLYENPQKGIESRVGIRFLSDDRNAGQMSNIEPSLPNTMRYQTQIRNRNFNASQKTGIAFGAKKDKSIGIINSYTYHEIDSEFGAKTYGGKQNTFYTNVLVSSYIGTQSHRYVAGGSFLYDRFDEWYSDNLPQNNTPLTPFLREEIVPGAFAEYTYSYREKMTFIAGLRGDYHNLFGLLLTPRTNFKYNFTDNIIFRASAGRGYRAPNVIIENIGFLASSRNINVQSIKDLDIEKAWNYGANLTFYVPVPADKSLTIGLDYYRTNFDNQAIMDMEYDKRQIYFYNLQGKSYANAWQVDVNATLFRGFDIFAAFRISDTKITYSQNGEKQTVQKPFNKKHRGLINVSYATKFEKWKLDVTAQFNGKSRLPDLTENGYGSAEEWSPAYPLYFAQITRRTKRLEIYAGCENIFNYKQKNPIIDAENPFSENFDASRIWGPVAGRKIYAGMRLRLGELK